VPDTGAAPDLISVVMTCPCANEPGDFPKCAIATA
jgi:hypothetical protein